MVAGSSPAGRTNALCALVTPARPRGRLRLRLTPTGFCRALARSDDAGVSAGNPVSGASVSATVIAQIRDTKVRVFKFKHRKHYKKTRGHRQYLTTVRVDGVSA